MRRMRVVMVAFVALGTVIAAEDSGSSSEENSHEEDSHEAVLRELALQSVVLQDQEQPRAQVSPLRYITCEGTTWSCEDCNTRRLCLEFWWYTGVTYYQCPIWAPYCTTSSTFAWCSSTAPEGCSGAANTTAAPTTTAATTSAATTAVPTTSAATTPAG